jgi:hypothetical protein
MIHAAACPASQSSSVVVARSSGQAAVDTDKASLHSGVRRFWREEILHES